MLKAKALVSLIILGLAAGGFSSIAASQEEAPRPGVTASELAVVSIYRRTSVAAEPFARKQDGPGDAFSIARDAQMELKRLGCYEGETNGFWSPSSRAAALKFLDRINAKLPVDKPEDALLALLRGKNDQICSQCPRGQELGAADRCVPAALLTRSAPPIITGSPPQPDSPAHANDERSSSEKADVTTGGQRSQPKPPGYWGRLIWKVDRALGLN